MTKPEKRRKEQSQTTRSAIEQLEKALHATREKAQCCEALSNHLSGFYEEIDKLAKGKTVFTATDLVVEQANHIVQDAKSLVDHDAHLDRVKHFVPAGDNPVYPDVLVTARAVKQSLERFASGVKKNKDRLIEVLREARTILTALELYLAGEEDVQEAAVEASLALDDNKASGKWFHGNYMNRFFDFDRLDHCDLTEYLSESSARED